jgi:hypothetical protein
MEDFHKKMGTVESHKKNEHTKDVAKKRGGIFRHLMS